MDSTNASRCSPEISLDPDRWEDFRQAAHRALDDALDLISTIREGPVWRRMPDEVREELREPVPREGRPFEEVYRRFADCILPYFTGNIHPRFFGWVHGTGLAGGIVAEMMTAAMNANCGGRDHGAIHVERAVIEWCKEIFGFPADASGLLVSGTSMANLIALTVARNAYVPGIRAAGLGESGGRLTVYASVEAHESSVKALEMLGLGSNALRKIPVDGDFRMDVALLRQQIAEDRAAGMEPFCAIGSAGTVNTGAVDDLDAIATVCADEGMWFHVDGAFGGLCALSDRLRPELRGIERADSLGFDFHKWMFVQYDAGCVLVRRGDLHKAAFTMRPAYLKHGKGQRGLAAGADWPCEFGPELSRGFRALKIWFAMQEHGAERFARVIEQNCAQAGHLAQRVCAEPDLELLAPVKLNVVCFRFAPPELTPEAVDELNEAIVADLHESGIAAPSTTRVRGRLAIRTAITNHRSRQADFDILIDHVLSMGRARVQGMVAAGSA